MTRFWPFGDASQGPKPRDTYIGPEPCDSPDTTGWRDCIWCGQPIILSGLYGRHASFIATRWVQLHHGIADPRCLNSEDANGNHAPDVSL